MATLSISRGSEPMGYLTPAPHTWIPSPEDGPGTYTYIHLNRGIRPAEGPQPLLVPSWSQQPATEVAVVPGYPTKATDHY